VRPLRSALIRFGERLARLAAVQRYQSAFGHVDVGTREECFLKLAESFSGALPAAGVADRLSGGNSVKAHEFGVERIECGCRATVDVEMSLDYSLGAGGDPWTS
jgi:hypothetical protein